MRLNLAAQVEGGLTPENLLLALGMAAILMIGSFITLRILNRPDVRNAFEPSRH
jgi:hypothetical protein